MSQPTAKDRDRAIKGIGEALAAIAEHRTDANLVAKHIGAIQYHHAVLAGTTEELRNEMDAYLASL